MVPHNISSKNRQIMIYGYIRVSTDKQTVENQRFEINNFACKENIIIDRWIEETISGTKEVEKRKLGKLMKTLKSGDTLICAELSRLGRSLLMIMSILHYCMKHDIQVWTIKDNFRLGKDIQSQVLAFAFGLSAQIERDLISMRTREALARKRSEGVILGRPKGRKSTKTKLTGNEAQIKSLLDKGVSKSAIGRILGVHRLTVATFIENEKDKILEAETNIEAFDNSTKRQINILLRHREEVENLLKRKGSIGAITSLFNVKPHIVTIFRRITEKESIPA
jgi:DNA invertase Pin-like site-specific DNA recombinase